jgi:hypothetical protein
MALKFKHISTILMVALIVASTATIVCAPPSTPNPDQISGGNTVIVGGSDTISGVTGTEVTTAPHGTLDSVTSSGSTMTTSADSHTTGESFVVTQSGIGDVIYTVPHGSVGVEQISSTGGTTITTGTGSTTSGEAVVTVTGPSTASIGYSYNSGANTGTETLASLVALGLGTTTAGVSTVTFSPSESFTGGTVNGLKGVTITGGSTTTGATNNDLSGSKTAKVSITDSSGTLLTTDTTDKITIDKKGNTVTTDVAGSTVVLGGSDAAKGAVINSGGVVSNGQGTSSSLVTVTGGSDIVNQPTTGKAVVVNSKGSTVLSGGHISSHR